MNHQSFNDLQDISIGSRGRHNKAELAATIMIPGDISILIKLSILHDLLFAKR